MAKFIKLHWHDRYFGEPIAVRVNVDNIEYYHYSTYSQSEKGLIDGSHVEFNDREIFVLEKPEEIDRLIGNLN